MSALPVMVDLAAVADILAEMSEDLEHLGATLCGNAAVANEHILELQVIDMIAQKQRALAELFRAECQKTAWAALNLDVLKRSIKLSGSMEG
jgi:hypothetical protein